MSSYRRRASWLLGLLLSVLTACGMASGVSAATADHLIISETVHTTRTSYSTFGSPFIKVVNPTGDEIDLSDVYLTNGATAPSTYYYNITLATPAAANPGGGNAGAFHARFPAGSSLAAGDSLAISINGSNQYYEAYGRLPDFELFEDSGSPDTVPEMDQAFPGSINAGLGGGGNIPALSTGVGSLVLYTWDGESDLVQDLDYFVWGPSNNTGSRIDKTGVTIGSGTYLADTAVADQNVIADAGPGFRRGFRRVDADEGTETLTGGNGVDGHNETSENLATTVQMVDFNVAGHLPPAPPGTHFPAAPIFTAAAVDPPLPFDGQEANLSATVKSNTAINSVTFHYSVDGGAFSVLTGNDNGGDNWSATVPGQAEGAVITWYAEADNGAGGIAVAPAQAPLYTGAWTVDEAPDPNAYPIKLLLSEICTQGATAEFIEIYNPAAFEVDLSDYYLTDSVHYENGYWLMGAGSLGPDNIGGGTYSDFTAQFPAGFKIGAGDTIVVSVPGSISFSSVFGYLPHIELYEDDDFPDGVPDMLPVFTTETGNSILTPGTGDDASTPSLTNFSDSDGGNGESLILFYYEAGEDLTVDIDLFQWGAPDRYKVDKSGITVGSSTYLPDTPAGSQQTFGSGHSHGQSYARISASEGTQSPSGSNGVAGRNETSEPYLTTFHVADFDPARPAEGSGSSEIELLIEAKTLISSMGEIMPIRFLSKAKSETKVRIFDLEGRVVYTIFDSRFDGPASSIPGAYTIRTWDGRDRNRERVKAGMYIVHLSVVSNSTGEEETITAPLVVATRLSK